MNKQKFLYKIDNNYHDIYVDDIMSTVVNNALRLTLINTNITYPETGEVNENGKLILDLDADNNSNMKKYIKNIKANVIIPIDLLPSIIKNLQETYDIYKANNSKFGDDSNDKRNAAN